MPRPPSRPEPKTGDRSEPLQLSLFEPAELDSPFASAAPLPSSSAADPAPAPAASPAVPSSAAPLPGFRHPQARRELQLGAHRIGYALQRARRRSIGFIVGAEGLTVRAPRWVGIREIEAALQAKGDWVLRKLHEQHERAQRQERTRIDWREGAALPYLGETVILLLDPRVDGVVLDPPDAAAAHAAAQGSRPLPGLPQRLLRVGLPQDAAPAQIRDAVQAWLQRQARQLFEQRCAQLAPRLGVQLRRLALSSASTRWGSASADGSIRLNWRLLHFRLPVIDYVVAHELAHLREMHHGPAFWQVVRSVIPDLEQHRSALRDGALPLL